jgi:hypothetical protein
LPERACRAARLGYGRCRRFATIGRLAGDEVRPPVGDKLLEVGLQAVGGRVFVAQRDQAMTVGIWISVATA